MRYRIVHRLLAAALLAVGLSDPRGASAQSVNERAMPMLAAGDEVRVYLDRTRSDNQIWVGGVVVAGGEKELCLRSTETEQVQHTDGPRTHTYEVTHWVPRSSILYVRRIDRKSSVPVTQPTTQPRR